MKTYEYHRIQEIEEQMEIAGVEREKIDQVMEGGKDILRKTIPVKKADWMRAAMIKMDELLDIDTRKAVREGCACSLGGKREKTSKRIAAENTTLEERIKAADEAHYVGSVIIEENGEIVVRFYPEGLDHYRCVCLPGAKTPLSVTYCYCCGGHVKHHLQIALGRELDCDTRYTALSSGGKLPCTFSFKIKD
jgi:hypothetical protein